MPSLSQRGQTIPGLAGGEQERGMREKHEGEKNTKEKRMKLLLYLCIFYFYEVLFFFGKPKIVTTENKFF